MLLFPSNMLADRFRVVLASIAKAVIAKIGESFEGLGASANRKSSRRQKALNTLRRGKQKDGKLDERWLYRLTINCKDVTDEDVQELFAKLIVEQGSTAGRFHQWLRCDDTTITTANASVAGRFLQEARRPEI